MIVLIDGVRYQLVTPENEGSLERAIQANYEYLFGPDSFYFDIKKLIRSKAGIASIPDGYAVFFTPKPRWAVVEVELASHRIYDHLIPQLSKFNRGIEDSTTRRELIEVFYGIFKKDELLKARLKQKIKTGEVHEFISELVFQDPLVVVIIDEQTEELTDALISLRVNVKVVEFKTFRRQGVSEDVNAFLFEPLSAKPIISLKPANRTELRSGPEPEFSKLKALEVKGKTRHVTMDDRTFELVRDNPHRFSEEEICQIICEEWPDKIRETVRKTTRRRLHGYLQKKLGVRIEKDADGKYYLG